MKITIMIMTMMTIPLMIMIMIIIIIIITIITIIIIMIMIIIIIIYKKYPYGSSAQPTQMGPALTLKPHRPQHSFSTCLPGLSPRKLLDNPPQ